MGTITIYIKSVNGTLYYRDNENDHGKTIETSVDPGDTIHWQLDQCSGIKEIKSIDITGSPKFFSTGPTKADFNLWTAVVADDAKGELIYLPKIDKCTDCPEKSELSSSSTSKSSFGQDEPAKLKVKL